MHEMALCEGILQILEENAESQGFKKIKIVWLEIGAFAGIELDAMRFNFDVVTKGTLAEHAQLEIIEIPAEAWCMQCSKTVQIKQRFDACPVCGRYQLQVTGGEQMKITQLEVE